MEKKTGKREATEARILESAIKLFAEQGFAGTSTSQIAKEAEVAEGTLFKYYPKKIDLLRRILFSLIDQRSTAFVLGSLEKLLVTHQQESPEFILKAIIKDCMALIKKALPLAKVILTEMQYYPELREIVVERVLKEGVGFSDRLLDLFEAKGYVLKIPRFIAFRSFLGMVAAMIAQREFAPELNAKDIQLEDEIDMVIQIYFNGVLAEKTS